MCPAAPAEYDFGGVAANGRLQLGRGFLVAPARLARGAVVVAAALFIAARPPILFARALVTSIVARPMSIRTALRARLLRLRRSAGLVLRWAWMRPALVAFGPLTRFRRRQQRFDRKRDARQRFVYFDYFHFNDVANAHDIARVLHKAVREF